MRRLPIFLLPLILSLSVIASSCASQGEDPNSVTSKENSVIFGIQPWESMNSVIAKNALAGIDSIKISGEKGEFKDLIDRLLSTKPPQEVHYFFTNSRVYRLLILFTGASKPFKVYANYFYKKYGQPVITGSEDYEEITWNTEQFIIRLRSNHQAETERQLKNMERVPENIKVTIDVIFTANPE